MSRVVLLAGLVLHATLFAGAATAQETLLVHLPSAPVESAGDLAGAVSALAGLLSDKVPGSDIQAQLFRRWSDANDFLEANGDHVALLLTEASFLLDRGSGSGLVPTHRLVRSGRGTYRRHLVVRSDADALRSLVDLQGRTLAIIETAGSSGLSFLERAVFEGEVSPLEWFGKLESEVDDFSATNNVLYGQAEAALIAEHNPLLAQHLGGDLRAVYTSPPLSLPVLAIREPSFDTQRRAALEAVLATLGEDARGRQVLEGLKLEGFEPVRGAQARAIVELPRPGGKKLEIALPGTTDLGLEIAPAPPAGELSFTLAVELPDIPLPRSEEEGN